MVFPCQIEYNNQISDDWDLCFCRIGSGDSDEISTGLELSPVDDELYNRIIDYGAKNGSPITFNMTVIHKCNKHEEFSRDEVREISQWLLTSDINWLKLYNDEYDDYWCLGRFTEISKYKINGDTPALILTFTSVSNYYYSDIIRRKYQVDDSLTIDIRNYGDEIEGYIYPNITITNHSGNSIKIKNKLDTEPLLLTNLIDNEIITIDGHNHILYSNMTTSSLGIKIFGDDFNRHWLKLYRGKNILEMEGNFDIVFEYREARRIGEF